MKVQALESTNLNDRIVFYIKQSCVLIRYLITSIKYLIIITECVQISNVYKYISFKDN